MMSVWLMREWNGILRELADRLLVCFAGYIGMVKYKLTHKIFSPMNEPT